MNERHLSKTVHYGTPEGIVIASREAMGSIDCDPATSERFNALYIKAPTIYTRETNGLRKKWKGNVILNPPGGKVDEEGNPVKPKTFGYSSAAFWFDKLIDQVKKGHTKKAIFVAFNMQFLQLMQGAGHNLEGIHVCVPKDRLAFLDRKCQLLKSPTQSNAILGINIPKKDFVKAFGHIGACFTLD